MCRIGGVMLSRPLLVPSCKRPSPRPDGRGSAQAASAGGKTWCAKCRSLVLAAAGLLSWLTLPAQADILFNQTPPPSNPNSFDITSFRVADDFTFSSAATVTDILFYYAFAANGTATDLGPVTYAIYSDNAGTPGVLIQSESILTGDVTRTGQNALCTLCASATFSLIAPLDLPGGTYWLELHADATLTGDNGGTPVSWANVADDFPNSGTIAQWDNGSGGTPNTSLSSFPGFEQFAFQLSGTTVPEPGSFVLLALGLLSLGVVFRRRTI
jgi:hypothetical protein